MSSKRPRTISTDGYDITDLPENAVAAAYEGRGVLYRHRDVPARTEEERAEALRAIRERNEREIAENEALQEFIRQVEGIRT